MGFQKTDSLFYELFAVCSKVFVLLITPPPVSGSGHTRTQINSLDAVIRMLESLPQKRFVAGSSPFMRLLKHLPVLRAWCKQCLPGR